MPTSVINEPDLALDRHDGNIFVITMRKAPENRLNSVYCQKLINAFHLVRTTLGPDSEGAVITRGNDAKFWCTVSLIISQITNTLSYRLIRMIAKTPYNNSYFSFYQLTSATPGPRTRRIRHQSRRQQFRLLSPTSNNNGLSLPNHRLDHRPHFR
jgi:hypothetical protein